MISPKRWYRSISIIAKMEVYIKKTTRWKKFVKKSSLLKFYWNYRNIKILVYWYLKHTKILWSINHSGIFLTRLQTKKDRKIKMYKMGNRKMWEKREKRMKWPSLNEELRKLWHFKNMNNHNALRRKLGTGEFLRSRNLLLWTGSRSRKGIRITDVLMYITL